MTSSFIRLGILLGAAAIGLGTLLGYAPAAGDKVTPIFVQKLATMPAKSFTVVTVDYAPGGASPLHHHADSAEIFAYVVEGAVCSKVNDGAERVYENGEFWYEPPGAAHSVSANASATEPARILAVIVADDGAKITTYDQ